LFLRLEQRVALGVLGGALGLFGGLFLRAASWAVR
jgi:hypothetical protein